VPLYGAEAVVHSQVRMKNNPSLVFSWLINFLRFIDLLFFSCTGSTVSRAAISTHN
jgi:hypothetical protein